MARSIGYLCWSAAPIGGPAVGSSVGWNYLIPFYRAQPDVIAGTRTLPEPQSVA